MDSSEGKLGVLAFGDSITNGGGELQWGVALQSWALWLARGLGLPYTGYAVDGATVDDVVDVQIPAFEARAAGAVGGRWDVGCLYIGVNDVRGLEWDVDAFAARHARAVAFLRERCDRVLVLTAPMDLGHPPAGERKVGELNEVVRRSGATVVDLSDFRARNHVMADRVHPTAFGQIAIAERALRVLERDGLPVRAWPSTLIVYETTWWKRLRGDSTYVYRWLKDEVRSWVWRLTH